MTCKCNGQTLDEHSVGFVSTFVDCGGWTLNRPERLLLVMAANTRIPYSKETKFLGFLETQFSRSDWNAGHEPVTRRMAFDKCSRVPHLGSCMQSYALHYYNSKSKRLKHIQRAKDRGREWLGKPDDRTLIDEAARIMNSALAHLCGG